MSASWDVQVALYDVLAADSTFMNLIGSRLSDEPETNYAYPYVLTGDTIENFDNTLIKNGYEVFAFFKIYTKPADLGFYTAKQILKRMNVLLNNKRLSMTAPLYMLNCSFDNQQTIRDKDKRIINVRYRVLVGDSTTITL